MRVNLDQAEWDFSQVPDEELHWRMVSEYARESPTLIEEHRKMALIYGDPEQRETMWRAYLEWCGGNAVSQLRLNPEAIKPSHWAEGLETFRRNYKEEVHSTVSPEACSPPESDSERAARKSHETLESMTGYWRRAPYQFEGKPTRFLWMPGWSAETLAINWRRSTDAQILAEIKMWLEVKRPKDCPEPSALRGKGKKRDDRQALHWLGALRALNCYSFSNPKFPKELKKMDEKEVYRWRAAAIKHFQKLFPFLPAGEVPVSTDSAASRKRK